MKKQKKRKNKSKMSSKYFKNKICQQNMIGIYKFLAKEEQVRSISFGWLEAKLEMNIVAFWKQKKWKLFARLVRVIVLSLFNHLVDVCFMCTSMCSLDWPSMSLSCYQFNIINFPIRKSWDCSRKRKKKSLLKIQNKKDLFIELLPVLLVEHLVDI